MDQKKIETNIGDVKGASINIASQHSNTTIHYTETVESNQELAKMTSELVALLKANFPPETVSVVSSMVNDAVTEAEKGENKDISKIKGLINVLSPIVQSIPTVVQTFSSWASMISGI